MFFHIVNDSAHVTGQQRVVTSGSTLKLVSENVRNATFIQGAGQDACLCL